MPETADKPIEQSLREAKEFLASLGMKPSHGPDDYLRVGDLRLESMGLTELPDLSRVIVLGGFSCDDNQLTSLKGCPASVGGTFSCMNNQLTSLEGAPVQSGLFFSDFGSFNPRKRIPEELLTSPETIARQKEQLILCATMLQAPTTVGRPLRYKNTFCL